MPQTNNSKYLRDVVLIALANFIWPLGYSMYINFFPIHIRQLGGNGFIIGLIIAIPLFAGILCIVGGILSDYMDRKKIILFGWAVTIPAPLIWAFADRWEWLLAGTVIYSLTWLCVPAFTIYIFDYESSGNKMLAYSAIAMSGTIGSIIGPVIGGKIIERNGLRTLYLVVFSLYIISTICLLPLSKQRNKITKHIWQYFQWDHIIGTYSIKKLTIIILFLTSLSFILNIAGPYLPIFLSEFKNIPVVQIGVAFTILSIGTALFIWYYGKSDGKVYVHTNIIIGLLIFLLSIVIIIYVNNRDLLLTSFFLRGVNGALTIFIVGFIASSLTGENKSFILSAFISIRSIFVGAAAFPGAFLYHIQPNAPFIAEGILTIIWGVLSFHYYFRNYWRNHSLDK